MSLPLEELDFLFTTVRSRYPRLPVLAIQWLYLTNGRYDVAGPLSRVSTSKTLFSIFARSVWLFLRGCWLGLQLTCLQLLSAPTYRRLKKMSFEGLAKTWGFPGSSLQKGDDFYFGDLSRRLQAKKISLLTLCGNAKEKYWLRFLSSHTSKDFPCQICELSLVHFFHVLLLWGLQCQTAFLLFIGALKEKEPRLKRILLLVSQDCLRTLTLRNALFYFIGKKACTLWKPKFFILLYEGHAWEKCLTLGIRKADPSCKVVAYQHTVLFKRTLDLRRPATNGVALDRPDVVLCTGPRTLDILNEGHQKNKTRLVAFGSFRFHDSDAIQKPRPSKKTILVLPEGLLNESKILFDAATRIADKFSDTTFIFRTHPVLPFKSVLPHLERDPLLLKNITVSQEKNIEKDFERSSILLYRGSSSVLYGILKGVKPFYFRQGDEESMDPLFELNDFRETVSSSRELEEKIMAYQQTAPDDVLPAWTKAADYVKKYTMSVRESSITLLLEAVGL